MSLESFQSKRCNVLVATDVALRGIDIPNMAYVINFDMLKDIKKYTHRIGELSTQGRWEPQQRSVLRMIETSLMTSTKLLLVQYLLVLTAAVSLFRLLFEGS
ncbi:P-loop containing nucleoside triphosphate hydrolase [Trema orientale]|uniref:P-loop containing nucleoside triphosphate hydrolase n=1 Tax=Trema orientale TaxID=63057 RepID=A0A2P5F2K3_TREOI|nr:P-loop containing nucleoside triphosphate hydrolase [Trema orientale]